MPSNAVTDAAVSNFSIVPVRLGELVGPPIADCAGEPGKSKITPLRMRPTVQGGG